MKKKVYILTFVAFSSCGDCFDSFLCGNLEGDTKVRYEKAQSMNKDLIVENIPCEFYYINLRVQSNLIDTISIHQIHKILYDPETHLGWPVILVRDKNNQYLFSHTTEGRIYIQSGD